MQFPAAHIGINGHAPQQGRSGSDFDEAVQAKTEQRNAAGQGSGGDGDQPFQQVPDDGEVFEASSTLDDGGASQNGGFGHSAKHTTTGEGLGGHRFRMVYRGGAWAYYACAVAPDLAKRRGGVCCGAAL